MLHSQFEIWQCDQAGRFECLVTDHTRLDAELFDDRPGRFSIGLPYQTYKHLVGRRDKLWAIWHKGKYSPRQLLGVFFARAFNVRQGDKGRHTLVVGGPDLQAILDQFIVAYNADTAYSNKTGYASDVALAYARENIYTLALDPERNLAAYGLAIQPDIAYGASITKGASRRLLSKVMQELQNTSLGNAAKRFYIRLVPITVNPLTLELRVYIDRLGRDFSSTGPRQVILAIESGQVRNLNWAIDYGQQVNAMYGAGAGEGSARPVVLTIDDARITGPFSRHEGFAENTQITSTAALLTYTQGELQASQPALKIAVNLNDACSLQFGDWLLGDLFDAWLFKQWYAARVRAVKLVNTAKGEDVTGELECSQAVSLSQRQVTGSGNSE